jgi:hypothetical protein
LNSTTKNLVLLLLLSATFILPACGSKEVKSEKVPETVLKSNTDTIAPPVTLMTETSTPTVVASVWVNAYTKHTKLTRHHSHSHAVKEPIMAAATPLVLPKSTPVTTPINFSTDNETPKKKSGSHWFLILSGLVLVAALGYYFWTKKAPPQNNYPLPPMGGLSPVGGFNAMRNKIRTETKKTIDLDKKNTLTGLNL